MVLCGCFPSVPDISCTEQQREGVSPQSKAGSSLFVALERGKLWGGGWGEAGKGGSAKALFPLPIC